MLLRGLKMLGILLLSYCNFKFIWKLFSGPTKDKAMKFILDEKNRRVIYHGVNVSNSAKHAPGYLPWQTKDDFARLKDWGFNMVRYLVFWQAIEPTKGSYNAEYMQKTFERINWLEELGIDVLIDFHQDVYSEKFEGNGFPAWTAVDLPFTKRSPWNLNYTEPAVIASFNNFWRSKELQNRYIAALDHVLEAIAPLRNIIGVDVMNEPFQGTLFNFEKYTLTNFYNRVQAMMIENNHKTIIFFEPTMLTSSGMPTNLKFKPRPGSVFCPHYYDIFCHEGANYTWLNKWLMKRSLEIKIREAQDLGIPLILGEFYVGSKVKGYLNYIKDLIDIANKYFMGWVYYSYDKGNIINETGAGNASLEALINIYPQKIAGKNISSSYSNNIFILKYETDYSIEGATEIFIPSKYKNIKIVINGKILEGPFAGPIFKYDNDLNREQCIEICWN